ncbi:unnamed protein product, partial [Prunus brigantina]
RLLLPSCHATGHGTGLDWTATTSALHFAAPPTESAAPTAGKAQKLGRFSPRFKPPDLSPPGTDSSNQGCGLACEDCGLACEDYVSDRIGISETYEDEIDGINGVDGS